MDEDLKKQMQDFLTICYDRLEKGQKVHGSDFSKLDLYTEIVEELADVANYAFMEYVKVIRLKKKRERLDEIE